MNKRNLNQIHSLAKYPMTIVMAQAWSLSTKCRHAVRGCGLLRDAREDLA
ncbi:MAG: hypothetical protein WC530_00755 [Candidatus Omnitrophota bacterium]